MSDESTVIAEAGCYRVLANGAMRLRFNGEWIATPTAPGFLGISALLADAIKRVREELKEYSMTLREGQTNALNRVETRLQTIEPIAHEGAAALSRYKDLAKRIEEAERDHDENSIDHAELGNRIEICIEHIKAAEKAIQDTRVDQGEMGLVTKQGERNITRRLEELEHRGEFRFNILCDELGKERRSKANLSGRLAAVEARITELDGWHPGYPDEKPLAERVAAVENRAACADSRSYAANKRLDALEAKQGHEERLWNTLDIHGGRLAAVERETKETELRRVKLGVQIFDTKERVSALEERQEASVTVVNEHERWMLEEINPRVEALEARQQDEVGEGAEPDSLLWVDEFERRNKERIRRELAREIVADLRGEHGDGAWHAEYWANWIEHEFGGE